MDWQKARTGTWLGLTGDVVKGTPKGLALTFIHAQTLLEYINTHQVDKNLNCRNVQTGTWNRLQKE